MQRVRIGVIGWSYPEWRGLVYPKGAKPDTFLAHYAERFPIVEAASSFYGMPTLAATRAWATAVPKGFEVSLKVPDGVLRKPAVAEKGLAVLIERVAPLAKEKKLGTLVAQFPPTFRAEKRADDLAAFVAALPRGPRWAVELRHDSWWTEETYALLRKRKVALVWSDLGATRTPPVVTSDRLYLRLFGDRKLAPPWNKKRRSATKRLASWAERIQEEGAGAKRVEVMVSKFLEGYAPASAKTMADLIEA